ncbi:7-cyano-7-deazaguanine/7-aminomethyl-7-deazaguanine transporter [Legionella pneumophila]|uniref:7-cyano-7-deazaguanine/7-aminomethyl-7- deazaguanine transporter n=1 Tax=Legionella pneumophila TaxID=446 RepID=UPI00048E6D1B|nr:7-cyano-7-deazaguanine/7-aminomethyl-7-deazaguanine transporter [Legionella pneumophila]RYB33673.1 7-cyano-7-deazaguanine/7-aminomethyl-7-deazaguanine transporter [Legionella pneumophila]RYW22709.1 7-cyano-7-deazaguanine/7-aminomethyl-7-deazaguanine transporter [Legionella pneumophila]HAT1869054.1 7-cyano-7-deazaguanine/7-aminomethyl-7-deazaguanine transporter [Legionella pneumophila]HAT1909103.1 7-cyano-7-deazaguanine/7-aminomethyl-7-deazaguanine transporter [Legionella pneumophila]HAT1918
MKAKGFFNEQVSLKRSKITQNSVWMLSLGHIFLITLSNVLVQYPFDMMGLHTTWGAFTYPAIFILTDLTTRIATANKARKIIMLSMVPGLIFSYLVASSIEAGNNLNGDSLSVLHLMPLRIALACFIAYVIGQLLDVTVFQRYRNQPAWWLAPTLSAVAGNFIDTVLFFTIAFYHCSDPFLSQNWPEIAMVDVFFKIIISLIAFVPVYGLVLSMLGVKSANK